MPLPEYALDTLRALFIKCQSDVTNEFIRGGLPPSLAQAHATAFCMDRVFGNRSKPKPPPVYRHPIGIPVPPVTGPGRPPGVPKGLLGPY